MPDSLFSREFQSVFSQVKDTGGTPKAFSSPSTGAIKGFIS